MMIPDCHRRIVAAHAELKQLLDTEVNRFYIATLLILPIESLQAPVLPTGRLFGRITQKGLYKK
jgi:hypothetical protein